MQRYLNYIIQLLLLLLFGCIENNNPFVNEKVEYSSIEIGEVRDLFISDSTLFVGTESEGLYVYKVNYLNQLELLYENIDWGVRKDIRNVYYDKNSQMVYALDRFDYVYEGYLPHIIDSTSNFIGDGDTLLKNECSLISTHATRFSVNHNTLDPELFILYKHNANNELYLDNSYAIIRHMQYVIPPSMTFVDGVFLSDCSNEAIAIQDSLNYNINDMSFNDNKFYLGSQESIDIYNFQGGLDTSIVLESEVKSVYSINNFVLGGTENGCYIMLPGHAGNDGSNSNILHIAEGYTIYDIFYDFNLNKLILSAGAKGVLVYDWDGDSFSFNFNYRLLSSYAFTARIYNNMVMVASKNGLEIFNIEE